MRRTVWAWARLAGPVLILAVLVWRLGSGPFLGGLRTIDGRALAVAGGIAVLTTVCCAWRWKIVAGGLGIDLPLSGALAAYYRSLFLNVTLPGGIVGDVHRGISCGREVSDVSRALRSVAWERFAGQVVQVLLTIVILLVLPSPVQSSMPAVTVAVVLVIVGAALLARTHRRALHAVVKDLRDGLLGRRRSPAIALASAAVVAGHAFTFLLAARTVGVSAPAARVLPLALLVMVAMVLPSVGGWGPREGVTAWAFAAAGLGAGRGVATAVVYGVMVFVASLPGAIVLVMAWFRPGRAPVRREPPLRERAAHA